MLFFNLWNSCGYFVWKSVKKYLDGSAILIFSEKVPNSLIRNQIDLKINSLVIKFRSYHLPVVSKHLLSNLLTINSVPITILLYNFWLAFNPNICQFYFYAVKPLITNTSEEFIKCRLDNFSTSFILYLVNFSICENK